MVLLLAQESGPSKCGTFFTSGRRLNEATLPDDFLLRMKVQGMAWRKGPTR